MKKETNDEIDNKTSVKYFKLNKNNLLWFAAQHYDNPFCSSVNELKKDLNTSKYLTRLFNRYSKTGEIKNRLVLNHLILFYNVFDTLAAHKILFFSVRNKYFPQLKSYLLYMERCPKELYGIEKSKTLVDIESIEPDRNILESLEREQ